MSQASDVSRGDAAVNASAALLVVFLTVLWGSNQVAIKISNEGFDPLFGVALRSVLGGILVYAWCLWRAFPLFERDGTLVPGILTGVFFGAEFSLIFIGLDYTTASRGALMLNLMPFWVLIGGHFLLGERITGRRVVGLVLAFGGVVLVFSDELSLPDANAIRGDIMCLVAGMLWAGINLTVKGSSLIKVRVEKMLLYQLAVSSLMLLPLLAFTGPLIRDMSSTSGGALVYQVVVIVGFSYMAWFWLMRRHSAANLASFALLTPAFGVLCGWLVLGEPLSWRILAALFLMMAGLYIVNRPVRRVHPA